LFVDLAPDTNVAVLAFLLLRLLYLIDTQKLAADGAALA
jgi:hypothetical protein